MPPELPPAVERVLGRAIMGLPRWSQRLIAGRPVRRDGIQLETEVQVMLRLQERFGGPEYDELDVAEARATLAADAARAGGRPISLPEVRDLDAGGVAARLYVPDGATAPGPLLVYFHGGGHVLGDVDTHDAMCRWLARETRIRLLAVDYRLAPEHPFPAAVDDALAGFRYATAHAAEIGADPARVAVGGDSAGGNLAAVVAQLAVGDDPPPAYQLLIYPVCDYSRARRSYELFGTGFLLTAAEMRWYRAHYLPDEEASRDPRASPLLREDLTGLPPAYVATAGFDPLRDEGEDYARALRAAGVPVTLRRHAGWVHGFANVIGLGYRVSGPMYEIAAALRWALTNTP
jgi:acetyl esterase